MQWNQYLLSYAKTFLEDKKYQICYQLWKFKLDMLIIIYFNIENNLYGMVTSRSLRCVSLRSTTSFFSMLLSILYYTFG